jgi:hypothetical protein
MPPTLEPLERLRGTREKPRSIDEMLSIMVQEVNEQDFEPFRRKRALLQGEAAPQEGAASLPDEVAGRSQRDRIEAFALQDLIECRHEIACRVGERAVEVEHDDRQQRGYGHERGRVLDARRSHAARRRASARRRNAGGMQVECRQNGVARSSPAVFGAEPRQTLRRRLDRHARL